MNSITDIKAQFKHQGNGFGSLVQPPYISLDGDDRTGNSAEGETLRINGDQIQEIKRVLIYTFIYDGAANWQEANGVVTLKYPGYQDIIVRMDEYGSIQRNCAIALLENTGAGSMSVQKVVSFFDNHQSMDRAFNWGLNWVPGRK